MNAKAAAIGLALLAAAGTARGGEPPSFAVGWRAAPLDAAAALGGLETDAEIGPAASSRRLLQTSGSMGGAFEYSVSWTPARVSQGPDGANNPQLFVFSTPQSDGSVNLRVSDFTGMAPLDQSLTPNIGSSPDGEIVVADAVPAADGVFVALIVRGETVVDSSNGNYFPNMATLAGDRAQLVIAQIRTNGTAMWAESPSSTGFNVTDARIALAGSRVYFAASSAPPTPIPPTPSRPPASPPPSTTRWSPSPPSSSPTTPSPWR